jgi:pimeloyl-ACP methyl ester carboxylesterase
MGGYIAFEVMRQAPERVTRLALLNTSAKPGTPESNAMREEMIALVRAGHQEKVMATMWQRLVAPSRLKDEPLKAIVNRMTRETGAEGYIRQQTAIMGRPDSRPGLAAIRVPTLVLVGSEDLITPPAEAEEIAGGIAGARLVVVEGAGHLSTIETPEPVTAALQEWLAA